MVKVLRYDPNALRPPSPEPYRPETDKERRKSVIRRIKGPSQPFDPNRISILLLLGPEIIEFVSDFFTLISLSRTCMTLYELIHRRPQLYNTLFDAIETQTPSPEVHWQHSFDNSICRHIINEIDEPWYWEQRGCYPDHERAQLNKFLAATDLVKYGGLDFQDVLDARALPCYGCKRIQHRGNFFEHYKTEHLALLACEHRRRRCIDCVFARPVPGHEPEEEEYDWRWDRLNPLNRSAVGDLKLYLIDMPKGIPGFRQNCRTCSRVRWVRTRPRKIVEASRVCEECFDKGLRAVSPNPRTRKKSTSNEDQPENTTELRIQTSNNLEVETTEQLSPDGRRLSASLRFDLLSVD